MKAPSGPVHTGAYVLPQPSSFWVMGYLGSRGVWGKGSSSGRGNRTASWQPAHMPSFPWDCTPLHMGSECARPPTQIRCHSSQPCDLGPLFKLPGPTPSHPSDFLLRSHEHIQVEACAEHMRLRWQRPPPNLPQLNLALICSDGRGHGDGVGARTPTAAWPGTGKHWWGALPMREGPRGRNGRLRTCLKDQERENLYLPMQAQEGCGRGVACVGRKSGMGHSGEKGFTCTQSSGISVAPGQRPTGREFFPLPKLLLVTGEFCIRKHPGMLIPMASDVVTPDTCTVATTVMNEVQEAGRGWQQVKGFLEDVPWSCTWREEGLWREDPPLVLEPSLGPLYRNLSQPGPEH